MFDQRKADRSRAARARQRAGRGLEDELKFMHANVYEPAGRAAIEKIDVPAQWAGANRWKLRAGGACVDWVGTVWTRGVGRAVFFDSKKVAGKATFALEPELRHQAATLIRHRRVGALTFFLLVDDELGVFYLLHRDADLARLVAGGEVRLREPIYDGYERQANDPGRFHLLLPHGFDGHGTVLLVAQNAPRWDWLAVIDELLATDRI